MGNDWRRHSGGLTASFGVGIAHPPYTRGSSVRRSDGCFPGVRGERRAGLRETLAARHYKAKPVSWNHHSALSAQTSTKSVNTEPPSTGTAQPGRRAERRASILLVKAP